MIQIDVQGVQAAAGRYARWAIAAQEPAFVFNEILRVFRQGEQRRFQTSGYGDWAPDLASTTRRKARHGQDLRTMRATGALYRSLTGEAPGTVARVVGNVLTMGTSLDEASPAQGGAGRRGRRVVAISRGQRREFADILRDHLVGS